jgi:hypothetical protein
VMSVRIDRSMSSAGDPLPADRTLFGGAREGYCFRMGEHGLGYYLDPAGGGRAVQQAMQDELVVTATAAETPPRVPTDAEHGDGGQPSTITVSSAGATTAPEDVDTQVADAEAAAAAQEAKAAAAAAAAAAAGAFATVVQQARASAGQLSTAAAQSAADWKALSNAAQVTSDVRRTRWVYTSAPSSASPASPASQLLWGVGRLGHVW